MSHKKAKNERQRLKRVKLFKAMLGRTPWCNAGSFGWYSGGYYYWVSPHQGKWQVEFREATVNAQPILLQANSFKEGIKQLKTLELLNPS